MISRKRHRRELTAARRAHRLGAEQLEAQLAAKERQLDALLAGVARARVDQHLQPAGGYHQPRILIDVTDPWLLRLDRGVAPEVYRRIAQRIVEGLSGLREDHRPDLREADKPALLRHY